MFPEKKVPYSDVRFKPQTLRKGRDVMINEAKADNAKARVETYFSITLHSGEEKTHATEEEFFADYRADKFRNAYGSWRIGERELVVFVHGNVVNVKVCAPDWARIEAIFSIFEEAKSDATIYSTSPTGDGVDITKTLEPPTFSLRKRLPSCAVDRSLLERLEQYLRNDIPVIGSIPDEGRRLTLNLEITDPLGTDKRTTIDTYPLTKFPDGTEQVDLSSTVSGPKDEHLAIRLCFHKDRDYCSVSINSKVPQAREIAVAAFDGIVHRLRPNTNLNKLLNWPLGTDFGAVLIASGLLCYAWVLLLVSQPKSPVTWIFLFAALLLPTIYGVAKRGYPYTSFDSAIQRRRTSRAKWIILAILTVFLLGTIARLLQRLILSW